MTTVHTEPPAPAAPELPGCAKCGQEECSPVHQVRSGHDFVRPEQRWSAETEQGVVVAVYRAADTAGYGAMPRPDGVFDPALRDARAALAYLADSGRLLPEGGETREEWAVRSPSGRLRTFGERGTAEHYLTLVVAETGWSVVGHRVTDWPNGDRLASPWEPVESGAEEAARHWTPHSNLPNAEPNCPGCKAERAAAGARP